MGYERKFIYKEETESTNNDLKKEIYSSDVPCYTVIRAARQTGGRGRLGRSFFSPEGGLYFSVAFPISEDRQNIPFMTLLSGLAVSRITDAMCGVKTEIKWPNDIYLNGKKLTGILCELIKGKYLTAVIGIGINMSVSDEDIPAELRDKMTSLAMENATVPEKDAFMRRICEEIDNILSSGCQTEFLPEIRAKSYSIGKPYTAEDGTTGIFTDIAENGMPVIAGHLR